MINMKRKQKKLTMAVGMALGVTVLAGAAFASYNTSNGYEVGKTAAKGLLNNENYTMDANLRVLIDGEEMTSLTINELYDRNGDVQLNRSEKSTASDEFGDYFGRTTEYKAYKQDGDYISTYYYINEDGNKDESTSVYKNSPYMGRSSCDSMGDSDEDDRETVDKIVRFVELIGDTVVGDLKNNIVYVSGDDNSSTYEISLDAMQIPEFVNAGMSAMFSSMKQYADESDDPFMMFGTDPIVKNASLKFTVDKEGRLTDAAAAAAMSGEGHELGMEMSLKMSDYGTTQPQRLDVSTLPNVETYDYSEENGMAHTYSVSTDDSINGEDTEVTIQTED